MKLVASAALIKHTQADGLDLLTQTTKSASRVP